MPGTFTFSTSGMPGGMGGGMGGGMPGGMGFDPNDLIKMMFNAQRMGGGTGGGPSGGPQGFESFMNMGGPSGFGFGGMPGFSTSSQRSGQQQQRKKQ